MRHPSILAAGVLLVVAGGTAAASTQLAPVRAAAPSRAAASVAPLMSGDRVCPDPSGVPDRQVAWVTTLAAGPIGPAARSRTNRVTVSGLDGRRPVAALTGAPQRVTQSGQRGGQPPVLVSATGQVARDFSAVQETHANGGAGRGLTALVCPAPGVDFSFAGVGTAGDEDPVLYLDNPHDVPALVDLQFLTRKGAVASLATQGIAVPARTHQRLRLVGLVPNQPLLAVQVHARTGRIAAALYDARRDGDQPRGVDWVPASEGASRSLVVPGLFQQAGPRTLYVANPGAVDTTVHVTVSRPDGKFVPTGLDAVVVHAGSVAALDVGRATAGRPAAVVLTSDHAVFASASSTLSGGGSTDADIAFTAATPPLAAPVPVSTSNNALAGRFTGLLVTAPTAKAAIVVRDIDHPTAAPKTIPVAAGTTYAVNLSALLGGAGGTCADGMCDVSVAPAPGSGPVYAAAYWYEAARHGGMLSVLPLVSMPTQVVVPPVSADLHAADADPR